MSQSTRRTFSLLSTILISLPILIPALVLAAGGAVAETASCGSADEPIAIGSGEQVDVVDPSTDSLDDCFFSIVVDGDLAGTRLRASIASTSDHNVYVKRDAAPSIATATNDCFGTSTSATSESCIVDWPLTAGTFVIRVSRASEAEGEFSLTATIEAAAPGCNLGSGVTTLTSAIGQSYTLDGPVGSKCVFAYTATNAGELVKFNLAAAATSTYLYVRAASLPVSSHTSTTSVADCVATSGTTNRNCVVPAVAGQTYYAYVYRFTAGTSGSSTITATTFNYCSLGSGVTTLAENVAASGSFSTDAGAHCDFAFTAAPGVSLANITATVSSTSGSPFLIMKRGTLPTTTPQPISRDCAVGSTVAGTFCTLRHENGVVYASVWRTTAGTATTTFTITAKSSEACSLGIAEGELSDNVPQAGSLASVGDSACFFRFTPSPEEENVRVQVAPSVGDVDLYVRKGAARASLLAYDCKADTGGAGVAETCEMANDGSELSVMVWRKTAAPAFEVTARAFSPCSLGGSTVPLVSDVPIDGALTADEGGMCHFSIDVPSGLDAAQVDVTLAEGDFDLFLRKGSRPTTTAYDCASTNVGEGELESCAAALDAGTYYASVRRASGSGAFTLAASAVPSCGLGASTHAIANATVTSTTLLDGAGAKCYFAFTPGDPLAGGVPRDDVVKFALAPDTGNFDLYVRKGALPTTTTRDCASTATGTASDSCELLVTDGSTYFAMVRRTSGSGAFSITPSTSSSCLLGPGIHALQNNIDPNASFRPFVSAACYFVLQPIGGADIAQFDLSVAAGPASSTTSATLSVRLGALPSVAVRDCGGTASYINYPTLGLVINTPVQCALPVNDSTSWYARVGAGSAGAVPSFKGQTFVIPTLMNGVAARGFVDTAGTQYWKVVVPEDATYLNIQTFGDPTGTVCSAGSQLGPTAGGQVSLACTLAALPSLVGCILLASQGLPVTCADVDRSIEARCLATAEIEDETCAAIFATLAPLCAELEVVESNACAKANGSYTGACALLAELGSPQQCTASALDLATVRPVDIDMYVRRFLLPTTSVNDCVSKTGGSAESCSFGEQAIAGRAAFDSTRAMLNQNLTALRNDVNANRTQVDAAIRDIQALLGENDPGAAAPATPGAQVPNLPGSAKALSGGGKYFIAIKGPAIELLTKGGDYDIVATHDGTPGMPEPML